MNKRKILWITFVALSQVIQFTGIIFIAWYNNKSWECVFVMFGFMAARIWFPRTYHLKTWSMCTVVTWLMFWVIVRAMPTFATSMLLPMIIGIGIVYVLETIQLFLDKLEQLKEV